MVELHWVPVTEYTSHDVPTCHFLSNPVSAGTCRGGMRLDVSQRPPTQRREPGRWLKGIGASLQERPPWREGLVGQRHGMGL